MSKSKNCYKCKHFYNCNNQSKIFNNIDKYTDKRIIRKFMRECDFRYCKKFKFLKTFQKDNVDFINYENATTCASLGGIYIPIIIK